jgi:hypothetical protein
VLTFSYNQDEEGAITPKNAEIVEAEAEMSADEIKKIEAEEVKTEAAEDKIMNAKSGSSSEMISESKATKVEASAMDKEDASSTETNLEKFSGDSTQTTGFSITPQNNLDASAMDLGNTEPSIGMPSTVITSIQQDQNVDKMTVDVTSSKENGQEHEHNALKDAENEVKNERRLLKSSLLFSKFSFCNWYSVGWDCHEDAKAGADALQSGAHQVSRRIQGLSLLELK